MLKNIEVTQDLLDYIYNHTQPLHPVQKDILTHNKTLGDIQRMQISEIQGHFLQLIIKISNVKNCLEIGTFTGFSTFTMALALPNGGKITTLDHDKKIVQNCVEDISLISGQRPIITKFKKSISNFKTRKGATAGVKVTLRNNKMYEFIDRLVNIALPRIKDFQGLSVNGFDNFGNYSFGIKEHIIFPEINFDKVDRIRGMDITLVTTGKDRRTVFALLKAMNFPFNKKNKIPIHQFIFEHYKRQTSSNPSSMAIFEKKIRSIANTIKDEFIKKYVLEYFLEKIN